MMDQEHTTAVTVPQWFTQASAHTPESRYFSYRGARIHYLRWLDQPFSEASKNNTKPVLLFCHGFRGHAHWWAFIASFFVKHYRVYALDFSGMGDSDHREIYDAAVHSGEILAFVEHLGVSKISLVAHSYGGGRAFRAAQKNSDVFQKIIAVDSHLSFQGDKLGTDPAPQSGKRYYSSLAEGVARFRVVPAQRKEAPWVIEYIARHSLKPENDQWTWKFDPKLWIDHLLATDGQEVMAAVKCSVDYIYGDESVVINAERANKIMAAAANKGRLIVIPGGHHHMMVSHPVTLISVLQALL